MLKTQKNYSLILSGALLLAFSAQLLLLAPNIRAGFFSTEPIFILDLLGAIFFVQSILLFASILLDYQLATQAQLSLVTAFMAALIGWGFYQLHLLVETFVILSIAVAFLLSIWFSLKRDWLVVMMQWTNLAIGVGLFVHPKLLFFSPEYQPLESASIIFAILFVLSALTSIIISFFPNFYFGKSGRLLSLPWFVWILLFIPTFGWPHLAVAVSIGLSLVVNEFAPWEKIVLQQTVDLGKRFFRLIVSSQIISLALMVWMSHFIETDLNISTTMLNRIREVMLTAFNVMAGIGSLTIIWINLSINGTFSGMMGSKSETRPLIKKPTSFWKRLANSLFEPFETSKEYVREIVDARKDYETLLARQLAAEKRRVAQLSLLHELNLSLEVVLDPPVAAQLMTKAIHNSLDCCLAAVMRYDFERDEMVVLAASGPNAAKIPPGYRQAISKGIVGRAAKLRRTQLASDTRLDPDYFNLEEISALSELVVPLLHNNSLRGVLVVDHQAVNFFDDSDMRTLETAAIQLVTSWIRNEYDQHLTSLISAGVTLSTTLDVEGVIHQIAEVAKNTLEANFVFVALADQDGGFTRTAFAGNAPTLLGILNTDPAANTLIQTIINSPAAYRLRDVRKRFQNTATGRSDLRSLLGVPIRLRQSSIGAILAFGKHGNNMFSENDEALITLLAAQSSAAIETGWLYQRLKDMLATATLLYQLGTKILLSEQLSDAASAIAETANQLSKGEAAGIVLFGPDREIEAEVRIDQFGLQSGASHPMELVSQALESGQTIMLSSRENLGHMCLPLQTPRRQYGALWLEVEEKLYNNNRFTANMQALANQAAIALERSILLVETRKQAKEIERAYHELELTYDMTLGALSSALDARDRETEGHSLRVSRISTELGRRIGLTDEQAKIMERGALLHDLGKIGISDSILLKPGPLTPEEWETMRLHPDIGAHIIEGIPFLQDALPVIRFHQERWDGSGYPLGLKGYDIPLTARIFAIVDAFDALTSDRPYRKPLPIMEAVAYLREKGNIHFDPDIVDLFAEMAHDGTLERLR